MTPVSCPRELSDEHSVTNATYQNRPVHSRSATTMTSSSSSSSLSGITTPVDGVPPRLVVFPKSSVSKKGLSSSDSSSSSPDKHRLRHLSFSSSAQYSSGSRPFKLSLRSPKANPIPALPSASDDHCPLVAFSLTSSAEGHLRSLITRVVSPTIQLKEADASPQSPKASLVTLSKRERASSLRSLPRFWTANSDIEEEEEETFWPRQGPASRRIFPSISRSSSPAKKETEQDAGSPISPHPRSRFASARALSAPKTPIITEMSKNKKPAHVRSNSYASLSAQPRAVATLRHPEVPVSPPRTFLRPAVKDKGKAVARRPETAAQPKEISKLDPALAAAENASRLRSKCVCGVCGKLGADFPRCPRCIATWCSRECRVSNAAASAARHPCNRKPNERRPASAVTVGA